MNFTFVLRQLGLLLLLLSACMAGIAGIGALTWARYEWAGERLAEFALLIAVAIGAALGLTLWLVGRQAPLDSLRRREALLLVALSWLVGAVLAALPYYLWARFEIDPTTPHPFQSFIACYFEAMSGLTTTGSTVLSDIHPIPKGLLLWRATTQWLGGLGIVVLFVAVLPTLGVGGKRLFQVETPGPRQQAVRPRIRETARVLWLIYLQLTATQILLLRLAGMTWFDSVCHTFATLATGGFSTQNASIGAFGLPAQIIIIVFMVLAGTNFGLYYQLARRRFHLVWRDPELRAYLGILAVGTVLVAGSIYGIPVLLSAGEVVEADAGTSLFQALFQVVSIQTTTGFVTAAFDDWPFLAQAVLVILMFVGGSAGSTGGGIKVIRIVVAAKIMATELERVFRPNVVRTTRVGARAVDPEMRQSVLVYILGILALFLLGAIALMLLEPAGSITFTTAATAAAATLNNIGPGLGAVGALENYGFFSSPSLLVMSLLMVLGRLEVYTILVLLLPAFWRSD